MYNICTMLAQRLRRWASIVQMLYNFLCLPGREVSLELELVQLRTNVRNISPTFIEELATFLNGCGMCR